MSSKSITNQREGQQPSIPRAIIHKQILDVAEANPKASFERLSNEVSGASENLVERVLDEYGDPADDQPPESESESQGGSDEPPADGDSDGSESPDPMDSDDPIPTMSEITEKQREVIVAIYEHPEATQRDLGALLGVSGATVSVHANSIPGFDWEYRQEYSTAIVESADSPTGDRSEKIPGTEKADVAELTARVDELKSCTDATPTIADPDLAHKVVHACMSSDHISEDEELTIIQEVMYGGGEDSKETTSR